MRLPGYEVQGEIGRGGMGSAHRATARDGRVVVVEVPEETRGRADGFERTVGARHERSPHRDRLGEALGPAVARVLRGGGRRDGPDHPRVHDRAGLASTARRDDRGLPRPASR